MIMAETTLASSHKAEAIQRCAYIVPKKNRPCKMQVTRGLNYCAEHACFDPNNEHRIPCPNNPRHTVDKRQLDEHLKRCSNRMPSEAWVVENINKRAASDEDVEEKFDDLSNEIAKVSKIIEVEYENIKTEISVEHAKAETVETALKDEKIGKIKHLKQISSIMGHLIKNHLLENKKTNAMFELGSGRGQLAFYMASQAPEMKYVLVDYSGVKHKADNRLKTEESSIDILRIRCPIEHVDASRISSLTSSTSVSVVCKHFCGSATDFGINCITNAISTNKVPISGFCLAPCCHHRIAISEYVGIDYLKSINIDTPQLISALRKAASWATCGPPVTETAFFPSIDDGDNYKFWSYEKKLILGRKAKALIEFGRVLYLRKICEFDCRLLEYIDVDTSPENLMIVGVKKG